MKEQPRDEERPWPKAQWEQLIRQSDVRSAKYGELFETLRDDPDRDGLIAHEMRWDLGEGPNPLCDLTSSSLNQDGMARNEINRHRIASRYRRSNFGMIRINWCELDTTIDLQINGCSWHTRDQARGEFG